jgi:hypothetical protein
MIALSGLAPFLSFHPRLSNRLRFISSVVVTVLLNKKGDIFIYLACPVLNRVYTF